MCEGEYYIVLLVPLRQIKSVGESVCPGYTPTVGGAALLATMVAASSCWASEWR